MLSREILFRGQIRKKGQKVNMAGEKLPGIWVYGGIFPGSGSYSIIYGEGHEELSVAGLGKHVIYSETVGQFTGKNAGGAKLFEGDIIRYGDEVMVVKWDEEGAKFYCRCLDGSNWISDFYEIHWEAAEIIGNIHDNPELLEEHHGR